MGGLLVGVILHRYTPDRRVRSVADVIEGAALNNGRVEQISPPFELYTRPRTSFVARFIGRNMIFGGETMEAASGKAVVKTQVGVLSGAAEQSLAVGAAASVVTPSEYVSLAREGAPVDPAPASPSASATRPRSTCWCSPARTARCWPSTRGVLSVSCG